MPSIESIGAISSLGGRAIDSSCPWLVKGMSSGTIESLKLRNYRISQELNKLFYASGIGKHDKSVLHILASSLVFKERKLQRLTEEKGEKRYAIEKSASALRQVVDFIRELNCRKVSRKMEFLDFLTRPRLRVLWTLRPPATSGSKHLEGNFHREGFNPATGSPTATLLRLHPSRRPHRG
ncbi:hypothetical protein L6452_13623 [Arctium lappa]|uniref:Uncharacterized protein n=1 Tax=Arctium lappa TaxID=4217 RepID=A0ACB9CIU5_ARCLA|nr:hypothetical protein L6452_13623 [Arctium lappa]